MRRCLDLGQGPAEISINRPHLFVSRGDITVSVRMKSSDPFPEYQRVIPDASVSEAIVSRVGLLDALKRAVKVSDCVTIETVENELILSCTEKDFGEMSEKLPARIEGRFVMMRADPGYLIEFLGQVSAEFVTLQFNTDLDPITINVPENRYLGIIMPRR